MLKQLCIRGVWSLGIVAATRTPKYPVLRVYDNGFSLLEILVTFLIALILLTITIPSQKFLLTRSTADVMRLQLLHAINLTRHEAMMRREIVTLCQSSNQQTCFGHWQEGYIILAKERVIYSFLNAANQGELYWRAFPKNQIQLHYLPSGALMAENGTFWYCLPAAKRPSWAIVLSQSGRAREVVPNQQGEVIVDTDKKMYCHI